MLIHYLRFAVDNIEAIGAITVVDHALIMLQYARVTAHIAQMGWLNSEVKLLAVG